MKSLPAVILAATLATAAPSAAEAQSDALGTRAAGMGGAFVAVADDASAVYWNPAGLASGSYVSFVLDTGVRNAVPDDGVRGSRQSSFLLAASMPALGVSYYRLRNAVAVPGAVVQPSLNGLTPVQIDTLVTHHTGVTFVQSLLPSVSVGSTLKVVHGVVSTGLGTFENAEEALEADEPDGRGTTHFDLDVGVMVRAAKFKAGLALHNLREPEFTSPEGRTLKLERQARAGVAYALLSGLTLAADLDLLEAEGAFGERRDAAFGLEARLASRAWVRSGFRFNTIDRADEVDTDGRRAFTFGGTFAATASIMLDAVVISGGDQVGRGWGVSGRFVY